MTAFPSRIAIDSPRCRDPRQSDPALARDPRRAGPQAGAVETTRGRSRRTIAEALLATLAEIQQATSKRLRRLHQRPTTDTQQSASSVTSQIKNSLDAMETRLDEDLDDECPRGRQGAETKEPSPRLVETTTSREPGRRGDCAAAESRGTATPDAAPEPADGPNGPQPGAWRRLRSADGGRLMAGDARISDRYELGDRLGSGGMSTVFAATDRCSSAPSRSRSWPSTSPTTRSSSPASAARRWPSRS